MKYSEVVILSNFIEQSIQSHILKAINYKFGSTDNLKTKNIQSKDKLGVRYSSQNKKLDIKIMSLGGYTNQRNYIYILFKGKDYPSIKIEAPKLNTNGTLNKENVITYSKEVSKQFFEMLDAT